jgi:predicted HicB family RNase H-like nuclease
MAKAASDFGLTTYHGLYLGSDEVNTLSSSHVEEHTSKVLLPKKICSPSSRSAKRLSLQVSSELHRDLKLLAMEEEETMNSLIVSVLRRHLKERKKLFGKNF